MTDAELDELTDDANYCCEINEHMSPRIVRELVAELLRARAVLRQYQWSACEEHDGKCPACNGGHPEIYKGVPNCGHAVDCGLAAVLWT